MKILEYLCFAANRYNHDQDIEIISCIVQKKFFNKIKIIILTFIINTLNFLALYALSVGVELLIIESSFALLISFKLSYIEFKRQGKKQSKKKIFRLMNQDLWDRWTYTYCYIMAFFNGYRSGKINENNYLYYFNIGSYLIITEVVFKWIKDIAMLKISGSGTTSLVFNEIAFEVSSLHESIKYDYLKNTENIYFKEKEIKKSNSMNSKIDNKYNEIDHISSSMSNLNSDIFEENSINYKNKTLSEKEYFDRILNYNWNNVCIDNYALVDKYRKIIDSESLILIELEFNSIPYLVVWVTFIYKHSYFLSNYLLLLIFTIISLLLRSYFHRYIHYFSKYYLIKFYDITKDIIPKDD